MAENRRLQQHIATLKAETNQIHRKLVIFFPMFHFHQTYCSFQQNVTVGKLRSLQAEFGVSDEWPEFSPEDSIGIGTVGITAMED